MDAPNSAPASTRERRRGRRRSDFEMSDNAPPTGHRTRQGSEEERRLKQDTLALAHRDTTCYNGPTLTQRRSENRPAPALRSDPRRAFSLPDYITFQPARTEPQRSATLRATPLRLRPAILARLPSSQTSYMDTNPVLTWSPDHFPGFALPESLLTVKTNLDLVIQPDHRNRIDSSLTWFHATPFCEVGSVRIQCSRRAALDAAKHRVGRASPRPTRSPDDTRRQATTRRCRRETSARR